MTELAGYLQTRNIDQLKGVGPALAQRLQRLGIHNIQDLLFLLPRHYEDRTRITPMGGLMPGMSVVCVGEVRLGDIANGRRRALLVRLHDGTGSLTLRYFHFRMAQKDNYPAGLRIRVYGEVRAGPAGPEMVHPESLPITEDLSSSDELSLTPVYPLVEGLTQRRLRELITRALPLLDDADALIDRLPAQHTLGWRLHDALRLVHAPPPQTNRDLLRQGLHPAQQRLAFEELVAHQLGMLQRRRQQRRINAPAITSANDLSQRFLAELSFDLTAAQQRVLSEIVADMSKPQAMLRLLQGDVGAGKTVVAALSACPALAAGWQVAIMAPTEILAEQHYQRFSSWLEPLGIKIGWLSGRLTTAQRRPVLAGLANGDVQLVIGTHALFQEAVNYQRLGLVIIDEQHRFGVEQRLALTRKGQAAGIQPHQLIMTATPIPRTLAMSAYGDLDTSIIDELPPGRQPIQTVILSSQRRDELIQRIRAHVSTGQQVYWVCTLIDESEQIQAQAAQVACELLQTSLPEITIGLVHGQLKSSEKADMMAAFAAGQISVLVATTVIEVGVDVPNASLMVIENPERLGLSQLHQLRGRVGRGALASFCVLLYQSPTSQQARQRLQIMRDSQDGFVIAEHDLQIRGPGEVLGTRQTGDISFKIADLLRDHELLDDARALAMHLMQDPKASGDYLITRWLLKQGDYTQV
ncbi:MAG: ATP-dependent DNA helicase RecG [Moraxellaceae bacterium]|nr:ATP-dependent DNA helicase RecG [Moraxellaceae bacterium]